MADFSAQDLLDVANARYGQQVLRNRVAPSGTNDDKDLVLLQKAQGVIQRVAQVCQKSVGWPLPGTWPAGAANPTDPGGSPLAGTELYRSIWPADLLEHAVGLLAWRTWDGGAIEMVSQDVRKIGEAHDKYFDYLADGSESLGIGVDTDVAYPVTLSSRDRCGRNLLSDGAPDRNNLLDVFSGLPWDRTL